MKLLYLKDPSGMFRDPETGLTIVKDATVPLRGRPGTLTQKWLNGGGLKIKEVPDAPLPQQSEPPSVTAPSLRDGGSPGSTPLSSTGGPSAPPKKEAKKPEQKSVAKSSGKSVHPKKQ